MGRRPTEARRISIFQEASILSSTTSPWVLLTNRLMRNIPPLPASPRIPAKNLEGDACDWKMRRIRIRYE